MSEIIEQDLQVTAASEWRRKTEKRRLPSGKVVELVRPSVISLALRSGRLPESMSKIIFNAIEGHPNPQGWRPQNSVEIADLIDVVCTSAFHNPKIVENPDYNQNQIAIEDVDEDDKLDVLGWAGFGGGQLPSASRSPDQPNGSVPTPLPG